MVHMVCPHIVISHPILFGVDYHPVGRRSLIQLRRFIRLQAVPPHQCLYPILMVEQRQELVVREAVTMAIVWDLCLDAMRRDETIHHTIELGIITYRRTVGDKVQVWIIILVMELDGGIAGDDIECVR